MKKRILIILSILILASFSLFAESLLPYKLFDASYISESNPVVVYTRSYKEGICFTPYISGNNRFSTYRNDIKGTLLYNLNNKFREVIITLAPTSNFSGNGASVSFYVDNMHSRTTVLYKSSKPQDISINVNYLSQLKIKTTSSLIAILNVEGK